MGNDLPNLYGELASWWPIFSRVEDYAEEAEFFHAVLGETGGSVPQTLLELGSGGGNNASFLKAHYQMSLVDLSPQMLEVSRRQNPECEHLEGDMRTVRLGRQFDAVFVHDAIMYMTTEDDLRSAMETAYIHCRPGGTALFVPDCVRETFAPETQHGGHDGPLRSIRYLEWTYELEEDATSFVTTFAYLLREQGRERQSAARGTCSWSIWAPGLASTVG